MAPSPRPKSREGPNAGRAIRARLKESEEGGTPGGRDDQIGIVAYAGWECPEAAAWVGFPIAFMEIGRFNQEKH